MSIGLPAATILGVLIGTGLATTVGPWIKHRLSGSARDAQRRVEPHRRLSIAAQNLLDATAARPIRVEGYTDKDARDNLDDALDAYNDARRDADLDLSATTRQLADAFTVAIHHYIGAAENLPQEPPTENWLEAVVPLLDASRDADAARQALRDQMQRELRG